MQIDLALSMRALTYIIKNSLMGAKQSIVTTTEPYTVEILREMADEKKTRLQQASYLDRLDIFRLTLLQAIRLKHNIDQLENSSFKSRIKKFTVRQISKHSDAQIAKAIEQLRLELNPPPPTPTPKYKKVINDLLQNASIFWKKIKIRKTRLQKSQADYQELKNLPLDEEEPPGGQHQPPPLPPPPPGGQPPPLRSRLPELEQLDRVNHPLTSLAVQNKFIGDLSIHKRTLQEVQNLLFLTNLIEESNFKSKLVKLAQGQVQRIQARFKIHQQRNEKNKTLLVTFIGVLIVAYLFFLSSSIPQSFAGDQEDIKSWSSQRIAIVWIGSAVFLLATAIAIRILKPRPFVRPIEEGQS